MCFSLKFLDFSELCQFCFSAGFLPAWWVYAHWHWEKTEKGKSPEYFKIFQRKTIFYEHPLAYKNIKQKWNTKDNPILPFKNVHKINMINLGVPKYGNRVFMGKIKTKRSCLIMMCLCVYKMYKVPLFIFYIAYSKNVYPTKIIVPYTAKCFLFLSTKYKLCI